MTTALLHDIRYALRNLRRSPAFTAVAVLTLALGIGATTAIFSVVNAVLLSPPPFADLERLFVLTERNPQAGEMTAAWPNYLDWRGEARSFERMAAYRPRGFGLRRRDGAVRVQGAQVTTDFFGTLGVRPLIGRTFTPGEDRPGAPRAAVLTHGAWQRWFGGDAAAIGRTLDLDGAAYTLVGVLRPDFRFLVDDEDLYVPAGLWADDPGWLSRGNHLGHVVVARLRPGVTAEAARSEMGVIARRLEREHPTTNGGQSVDVRPLEEIRIGDVRSPLTLLLAAVGLVLLIACANVANLLLAAGAGRRRELAIRAAIGATRRRVLRQLLTESVMLSLAGGALGVALAVWGISPLVRLAPEDIPGLRDLGLDGAVLAFALGISTLTGVAFGLAPALHASAADVQSGLGEEGRGSTPARARRRLHGGLLIGQVALTLVLLAGSGLMVRSMLLLRAVDPGFEPGGVLAATVALPDARYGGAAPERRVEFFRQVVERARTLPGVRSAAAVYCPPVGGGCWGSVYIIEGRPVPAHSELPSATFNLATPGYFTVAGIPLLSGRGFTERDDADAPPVIVVNEAMARLHWPGRSPLGERLKQGFPEDEAPYREVVGVVRNVPQAGLDTPPEPEVYLPYSQMSLWVMTLVVRTAGDPIAIAGPLAREVHAVDPDVPLESVQPLSRYLSDSVARRRFTMLLLALFAGLAVTLSAVGVYGLVSYGVSQRTGEIGIRMALGADRGDVLAMLLRQAMRLVGVGLAVGLAGAFALTRLLRALLFGVTATDAPTYAGVTVLLASVALVACWVPARRALGLDPLSALRHD